MAENPDRVFFFSREEMLLKRYMTEAGVKALSTDFDLYLQKVITRTLEKQKAAGAPAIKFEAAYLRALDFAPATEEEARAVYGEYVASAPQNAQTHGVSGTPGQAAPDAARYKKLQDYLFQYIAHEAGRLGMSVHLHTGNGCGGYFKLAGANPLNMEGAVTNPALRKTNFVLIHGGVPFTKEMAFELGKPNVYTDFSEMTALLSVRALGENIRYWLELYPEKVLYGTDLAPGDGATDWEENGWLTNDVGRRALALALTGMMHDGEITRARALELAHMALHDNAARLYGLP
jgi:predicted TIM-barrel fold metal-dependent hydrolase